jgi:hypothetical protein
MTRALLRIGSVALVTVGLVISVLPAAAGPPAAYDPPALSITRDAPSYVSVHVTSGASGCPNGFYVEWMYKSVFDALGGWPADPYDPSLYYCAFDGLPSLHVGGLNGYKLDAGQSIDIVLGELFDETGMTTDYTAELTQKQGVIMRAYTMGDAGTADSPFTPDLVSSTTTNDNCTFTQGYWKTHYPAAWPVFTTMMLGNVAYTPAQLEAIFNKQANGNGLISLAHQLIAAKLNILAGADGSSIQSVINNADALIGNLVVPPVGGGTLAPALTDADTNALDDYNNGLTGPGHCTTPTRQTTWGELKTLYR